MNPSELLLWFGSVLPHNGDVIKHFRAFYFQILLPIVFRILRTHLISRLFTSLTKYFAAQTKLIHLLLFVKETQNQNQPWVLEFMKEFPMSWRRWCFG